MTWNRWYVVKSYTRGSLWLVPFFSVVVYWAVSRVTDRVGLWLLETGWIDETTAFHALDVAGARTMLEMIITLNISFLVFTFGSMLVAIQVAGGQYTPRIIATTLLRDNAIRVTVGYFVFTLLFTQHVLVSMSGDMVDQFNTFTASTFGLVSIVIFLYLIDHAARMLLPVSIVRRVGAGGIAVIQRIYPNPTRLPSPVASTDEPACRQRSNAAVPSSRAGDILQRMGGLLSVKSAGSRPSAPAPTGEPSRKRASPERIVAHAGFSGVVLAVDLAGLAAQAEHANGTIEFVPQVGDFVAVDEPLFRLYGGAGAIDDITLRGAVAFGSERDIEQDPTFAFRILVDIAIKSLSAAINDPTTAVTSIDQVHRLLRTVGGRDLRNEEIRDASGAVRLVFRTPNWEDYVHLSCIEIRHCGAGSVQIARRMRSMLENLEQTLPPHRHAELQLQLALLDLTIKEHYTLPEDLAIARIADSQGLGGSLGLQAIAGAPMRRDTG